MFYPGVFVSKDSLLYRMYVHSCIRRVNTVIPIDSLKECLSTVDANSLSLRLQSRLMISVASSLLFHYRQTLSALIKVIGKDVRIDKTVSSRVASKDAITYKYNINVLCSTINYTVQLPTEDIECMRGGSIILAESITQSTHSMHDMYTAPQAEETVKRIKLDKTIDVSRETVAGRVCSIKKWYQSMIDAIIINSSEYYEPDMPADISSIEAIRRYSSEQTDDVLLIDRSMSIPISNSIPTATGNQRLADFISLLYEITEGKVSAIQAVPYGRIIRI
ncbi:hypothetical protein NEIRO02_1767 [Nematocida sp. AWRm79]|nr:hypothetical protein NEIRO02_1767 [Nematocida sp. AWRm79]